MVIIAHCANKIEKFSSDKLNLDALTLNQRENKTITGRNICTLYAHLKKKLVPLIIEDRLFDEFIRVLYDLNLQDFGDIITGKTSVDITLFGKLDKNLSLLVDNGGVCPSLAFLDIPPCTYTPSTNIEKLSNFEIVNGVYLKNPGNASITPDNVYYPAKWYYKTNTHTNELEMHISYVTKANKL